LQPVTELIGGLSGESFVQPLAGPDRVRIQLAGEGVCQ
jgi:hypothetical protein